MSSTNKNARSGKRQKELEYCEKLQLVDAELMSFYQYCQQMGFTESEMEVICSPLLEAMHKNTLKKMLKSAVIVILIGVVLYALVQMGTVAVHLSAIGRILMIKVRLFINLKLNLKNFMLSMTLFLLTILFLRREMKFSVSNTLLLSRFRKFLNTQVKVNFLTRNCFH